MHDIYFARIVFLLSKCVEWSISWPQRFILKIWPQVKVMTFEKVILHISWSASSVWIHHTYGVFIALAGLYQKLLPENCWWLLCPEMTFTTWRGVTGRNISTQGVKTTCNPMFESVSNVFCPKETPFIFLPLTYNGEVAKLTWPWVTDIKIPR